MKTKLIIGLVFLVNLAFSQDLKPVLRTDFNKYVAEMDAYYKTHDRGKGSGYKQFMRWQSNISTKVGRDGIIKNFSVLNLEEYQKTKPKYNPNARPEYTHGRWEDMGPHDYTGSDSYSNNALARLNCIAFHPTDPNTIWVGTPSGGLWKTTDHGGNWNCISNDFASIGVSSVVVDYTNTNIIYILTGDGDTSAPNRRLDTPSVGIMKTIDGGITWKKTGLQFTVDQIVAGFCLRMHPTNPAILLAGFRGAIFKTINGGETWSSNTPSVVWDIEFKPGDPTVVYAATDLGVMKSINTGDSFSPANNAFPIDGAETAMPRKTWNRLSIAVSPSAPNNVYVLCGGVPASGQFSGLYKSTNSAANWVLQSNSPNIFGSEAGGGGTGGQPDYDIDLVVDPINDARIFMGGINCWKSDANGATGTWSRETNWQRTFGAVDPFVHADFHALKFRGNRLYACNDGGIYYTDDYGHSWADISSGIGATMFYNIDIDDVSYIGGTQDNGTNEANFGNYQMHNIGGGDGFGAIWHATNHGIKFFASQDYIARRQGDPIFGIPANLFINNGSGLGQFWDCTLKNATDNPGILWGIQFKNTLIRGNQTEFGGPHDWSWHNTNNSSISTSDLKGYSQGGNNANIMYLAHTDTLLKTTNAYALPPTWTGIQMLENGLKYDDIITDPTNHQKLWVVCSGYINGKKVFKSINGGGTWTNISGTLPNVPVICIALQPGGGDKLYIGTTIGVFYRSGIMSDWVYFSNGLPNVEVKDIKLNATHVYAGTYGRGIWRSELYTTCPEILTLTPANETFTNIFSPGKQVYSAENSLSSTRQYKGSVGTEIHYNATQFVELKEGFEIKKDAFLLVKNKGCPE